MDNKSYWTDLGWEGQKFYLPKYTELFRSVENDFSKYLTLDGFQECLFPKLPTLAQNFELKSKLPRLSKEWSTEIIDAGITGNNNDFPDKFTLAHWQCEPFYYFLQKHHPQHTVKFFDKSGWSYRAEPEINSFRLFEFQRIESVWYAPENESIEIHTDLMEGLNKIILSYGLDSKIIKKDIEEAETQEKKVYDIEVELKGAGKIELVGSHLHGRLFIEGLDMQAPENFYTGCCGIGLNRIVNAIIHLQ